MTVVWSTTGAPPQITRTANCPAGSHAIAGGGLGGSAKKMVGSYPSNSSGTVTPNNGTNPTSWTATFESSDNSNIAYAICVPN